MDVTALAIPDVLLISPTVFGDDRGFFLESFHQDRFNRAVGQGVSFVQDNHSQSKRGTLRGLHYQLEQPQGKLVRVTHGAVFDVAVDLRRCSPTFGRWVSALLSEDNKQQLWIPPGFAHGFLTLSETVDFLYKTTDYYNPRAERCIRWDDPDLAISWPSITPLFLSERDQGAGSFAAAEVYEDGISPEC